MPDRFADYALSLESPAITGFAVAPSDGADLADVTRAVFVGGSGSLAVVFTSGTEVTLTGVAGGSVLPLRVRRIKATGTTATGIVGLC